MPPARKRKAAAPADRKIKKHKIYNMPEKIKEGTILKDILNVEWKIGASIGTGGFGEIYSAAKKMENKYDYVVKCEPHDNGPLFVEMHFYMRVGRYEDIQKYKKEHNLKSFGMPYMLGHGSEDINGIKHRFLVLPRYDIDLAKLLRENDKRLPQGTCYRIAIQMLDVYEYIHNRGYIHGDLKPGNILIGHGKQEQNQAYLVDFGLATHYITDIFKPDPKKMHDGTIDYTSRDAHLGVPTMRGDLEILAYNLIKWLGAALPWVTEDILETPIKVHKAKENFMSNVAGNLQKLFPKGVPIALNKFLEYVANMKFSDKPDYNKCRNIFSTALTSLKSTGNLFFNLNSKIDAKNNINSITNGKEANKKIISSVDEIKNKTIEKNIKSKNISTTPKTLKKGQKPTKTLQNKKVQNNVIGTLRRSKRITEKK